MKELLPKTNEVQTTVQVRFAHMWPTDIPGIKPRAFYHVVSGDYQTGSTVTLKTLHDHGLRVEVLP